MFKNALRRLSKVWLAEWAMFLHAVLATLGVAWGWLVGEPVLAAVFVVWEFAAVLVYAEWRNGG